MPLIAGKAPSKAESRANARRALALDDNAAPRFSSFSPKGSRDREAAAAFRQRGIASPRIPALCRALRLLSLDANGIALQFVSTP
jgi:hypothetical protein